MEELRRTLAVPPRKLEEMQQQSSPVSDQREALINYYIELSEWASWTDLANSLYHEGQNEAVATAKAFIKKSPGMYMHIIIASLYYCCIQ